MHKIENHPILDIRTGKKHFITFNGQTIESERGFTIAAALHQAGFPVHSHSLKNRERSLECGIGKCGACEMLVDGQIRRICITTVDKVKEVSEIPRDYTPPVTDYKQNPQVRVYKTQVLIIGAGPAGLAAREELNRHGVENLVIDNNEQIGGQFTMQTHQFFFFEKEKKYGGMRGFEIAKSLAGDNHDGIFLNSSVWDILEGKRVAVKNIRTDEIYYVDAEYLVIATGAVPFMPTFENDDLPGVYTAAVVQKMMNNEFTLLGRNVLTVGAGNIGYLTSYQLMQAGAKVKSIIEAQPFEGGFPVQGAAAGRMHEAADQPGRQGRFQQHRHLARHGQRQIRVHRHPGAHVSTSGKDDACAVHVAGLAQVYEQLDLVQRAEQLLRQAGFQPTSPFDGIDGLVSRSGSDLQCEVHRVTGPAGPHSQQGAGQTQLCHGHPLSSDPALAAIHRHASECPRQAHRRSRVARTPASCQRQRL